MVYKQQLFTTVNRDAKSKKNINNSWVTINVEGKPHLGIVFSIIEISVGYKSYQLAYVKYADWSNIRVDYRCLGSKHYFLMGFDVNLAEKPFNQSCWMYVTEIQQKVLVKTHLQPEFNRTFEKFMKVVKNKRVDMKRQNAVYAVPVKYWLCFDQTMLRN